MGKILKDMRKNNYTKTLHDIQRLSNMLQEAYVYDENDPTFEGIPEDGEGEVMPMEDGGVDCNDVIMQIRKLALQGIEKLQDNVDDPNYEFFKKIFLETDKILTEKEGPENEQA